MISRLLNPLSIVYSLPAILIAIVLHEYAHAYVSYKLGDPTAEQQGRLTLNPFAHLDPIGFIMLLLVGFGWARPVPINPSYYKNRRQGTVLVSLAGVITNLLLAFIAFGVYFYLYYVKDYTNATAMNFLLPMFTINIALCVFNLLPIPPLDGFNILLTFLKPKDMGIIVNLRKYGFLILVVLMITGIFGTVISFAINVFYNIFSWFYLLLF